MDVGARRWAAWGLGGAAVAISLVAMAVLWRGGGVQLGGAPPQTALEMCNAQLNGSPTIAAQLAPAIARGFLAQAGYEVAEAAPGPDAQTTVIQGRRAGATCTLTLRATSSTEGLEALAAGEALIALSSRAISERDQLMFAAANAGDFVTDRALAEHQIGLDAIAVVVNAQNPLTEIDIGAVRDIGVGVARVWSDLGLEGAAPIHVHAPRDGNMPRDFPNDVVPVRHPAFETIAERARMHDTEAALAQALGEDAGGFSIASTAFLGRAPGVKVLPLRNGAEVYLPSEEAIAGRRYPLVRRLFLYARPRDARENTFVKSFLAFAESPAVDPMLREAGFFPRDRRPAGADDPLAGRCIMGTVEAAAVAGVVRGASRVGEPLRFEQNTARIEPSSRRRIEELAPMLRDQITNGATGVLIGHADVSGDSEANRSLALRRAVAVRDAFETQGVVGLSAESAGEMCIGSENVSVEGRLSNQRVELWVRPPAGGAPS